MCSSDPFALGPGSYHEEKAERLQEAERMEDTKETRSSKHSRTEMHMNSPRLKAPYTVPAQALVKHGPIPERAGCIRVPTLNEKAISNWH